MRRHVAGLCTVGLIGAAAGVPAAPVAASSIDVSAATAAVCTPGTWVHEPANVLSSQGDGTLFAAAVASSKLAWAVGFYQASSSSGSVIEKWTGGHSWSVVGTGGTNAMLDDVAAFGVSSAFAVGFIAVSGVDKPLVSHWNGSTWTRTVLPAPAGATSTTLSFVGGSSANDVWAFGNYEQHGVHLLLEHWNGTAWSKVTIPTSMHPTAEALGILSLGVNDVWLAGFSATNISRFWHYDGSWSLEATPPMSGELAGSSDTNIWTIGPQTNSGTSLAHFTGSSWALVDSNGNDNFLVKGIALGGSPSTIWTVGTTGITGGSQNIYIAKNGVTQSVPTIGAGQLFDIATGFGLAFAVGEVPGAPGEPIVVASCD
jgi:hypothetical protein